jgi:hypothetical protein
VETINFGEKKTLDALKEMVPNGPDCSIEAVGFHYASTILHKVLRVHESSLTADTIFGSASHETPAVASIYDCRGTLLWVEMRSCFTFMKHCRCRQV